MPPPFKMPLAKKTSRVPKSRSRDRGSVYHLILLIAGTTRPANFIFRDIKLGSCVETQVFL